MDLSVLRKELEGKNARDLMKMATALGIKGAWDMKKAQVIERIIFVKTQENAETAKEENEKDDSVDERKMRYIEDVEVGTLVAFKDNASGKVRSAKVLKKSSSKRKLMVETEYGASFVIPFTDVLWVKTGTRWPRGIFLLLKGMKNGTT